MPLRFLRPAGGHDAGARTAGRRAGPVTRAGGRRGVRPRCDSPATGAIRWRPRRGRRLRRRRALVGRRWSSPGSTGRRRSPLLARRWPSCAIAPPEADPDRGAHEAAPRGVHAQDDPRARVKRGATRIAVVCGAWHAPALDAGRCRRPSATPAALRGLPRRKVTLTWVPWTHQRLAQPPGYGAGRRPRRAGTTTCATAPGPAGRPLADPRRRSPAGAGPADVERARHRGGAAGRDAGRVCAAGRWPGWPR